MNLGKNPKECKLSSFNMAKVPTSGLVCFRAQGSLKMRRTLPYIELSRKEN